MEDKVRFKYASIAFTLLCGAMIFSPSTTVQSQMLTNDMLDSIKRSSMAAMEQQRTDFTEKTDALIEEYEEHRKRVMAEYEEHCKQVKGMWGDDEVVESEPKQWVEYSDDLTQRSVVDFESGEVKVEILVDADAANDQAAIEQQLQQAVEQLIASRGKSTNYKSEYEAQEEVSPTPIIATQLDTERYGVKIETTAEPISDGGGAPAPTLSSSLSSPPMPTYDNTTRLPSQKATVIAPAPVVAPQPTIEPTVEPTVEAEPQQSEPTAVVAATPEVVEVSNKVAVAEVIVKETAYTVEQKSNSEGEKKALVTLSLKLNTDHISTRAAEYSAVISKNATRFSVDEALVYSIMEQESSFNPMAKSHIPAYGLMQLVPSSGGRDAYNYVFKEDILPTSNYLYEPSNNVELGTAYLRVVQTRYFSKVTNSKSQMLCMIASYNAGAGGVSRAINGTTNIFKAIPTINEMSYDDLYAMLRKNLPAETQDYIYKVTRNYDKYTQKK